MSGDTAQQYSSLVSNSARMEYDLWMPQTPFHSGDTFPLIVYMHGLHEPPQSGIRRLLSHPGSFQNRFIVLMPRCDERHYWLHHGGSSGYRNNVSADRVRALDVIIKEVIDAHPVDADRVTMVGFGMGGNATANYLEHSARYITNAVIVAGHLDGTLDPKFFGDVRQRIKELQLDRIIANLTRKKLPLWILHSEDDDVCSMKDMLYLWHRAGWLGCNVYMQTGDPCSNKAFSGHYASRGWLFGHDGESLSNFASRPTCADCTLSDTCTDYSTSMPLEIALSIQSQKSTDSSQTPCECVHDIPRPVKASMWLDIAARQKRQTHSSLRCLPAKYQPKTISSGYGMEEYLERLRRRQWHDWWPNCTPKETWSSPAQSRRGMASAWWPDSKFVQHESSFSIWEGS